MTNELKPDKVYGTDKDGKIWRAYAKRGQFGLTVLEVLNTGNTDDPDNWDFWAICDDGEMNNISYRNEINWTKDVIEA